VHLEVVVPIELSPNVELAGATRRSRSQLLRSRASPLGNPGHIFLVFRQHNFVAAGSFLFFFFLCPHTFSFLIYGKLFLSASVREAVVMTLSLGNGLSRFDHLVEIRSLLFLFHGAVSTSTQPPSWIKKWGWDAKPGLEKRK
jgi:hypothetical protein